ncbi:MAG: hypothetical protein HQ592_02280 [Planctomycetes bacterium]|nr:hypothetical protein [Planctomycetota bacterium]
MKDSSTTTVRYSCAFCGEPLAPGRVEKDGKFFCPPGKCRRLFEKDYGPSVLRFVEYLLGQVVGGDPSKPLRIDKDEMKVRRWSQISFDKVPAEAKLAFANAQRINGFLRECVDLTDDYTLDQILDPQLSVKLAAEGGCHSWGGGDGTTLVPKYDLMGVLPR